jgi:hypothetical protein
MLTRGNAYSGFALCSILAFLGRLISKFIFIAENLQVLGIRELVKVS